MLSSIDKIYEKLKNDSVLTEMLGLNKPFYDSTGTPDKVNSILPLGMADAHTVCPFIMIQDGVASRVGEHLVDETFYLRVYNNPEKAFVAINQIGERVITLLHLAEFDLNDGVHIKTRYESALQAAQDQGLRKNFRELRFRLILL